MHNHSSGDTHNELEKVQMHLKPNREGIVLHAYGFGRELIDRLAKLAA